MTHHIWVEKYRPSKLDDVSSQDIVIETLKNVITTKTIPHLLFYGPSGCGKTSTILALANELFGETLNTNRIIELNASDERGINIIRDKIKKYAKQIMNTNNDAPPWKLIILDEADTMTSDSQFALRRIMEQYSKITRFCIICNYHTKIIDPIISRCSVFHFKPINNTQIINKLQYICDKENINYPQELLVRIIELSRGDLRRAINFLQKCSTMKNVNIDEISGILPEHILERLFKLMKNKDIHNIDKLINKLYHDGYSLVNQILIFHNKILQMDIDSYKKAEILHILGLIDHNLIKGSNEYIQFMRLVYFIMKTI